MKTRVRLACASLFEPAISLRTPLGPSIQTAFLLGAQQNTQPGPVPSGRSRPSFWRWCAHAGVLMPGGNSPLRICV